EVTRLFLCSVSSPHLWDWWCRTALFIAVDRKECAGGSGGRGGRGGGTSAARRASGPAVSSMDIVKALLAADVDVNPQLNFHRPSRGGNSGRFIDPLLNTGCTPLL